MSERVDAETVAAAKQTTSGGRPATTQGPAPAPAATGGAIPSHAEALASDPVAQQLVKEGWTPQENGTVGSPDGRVEYNPYAHQYEFYSATTGEVVARPDNPYAGLNPGQKIKDVAETSAEHAERIRKSKGPN